METNTTDQYGDQTPSPSKQIPTMYKDLPQEIRNAILKRLDLKALYKYSMTSKRSHAETCRLLYQRFSIPDDAESIWSRESPSRAHGIGDGEEKSDEQLKEMVKFNGTHLNTIRNYIISLIFRMKLLKILSVFNLMRGK